MNKKIIGQLTVLGLLVAVFPQNVLAEEEKYPASARSNATVELVENDGEDGEKPVDPTDPSKPVKPAPGEEGEENPHPPSTKGPLSINYISNLRFGKHKASGNDEIFEVKPDRVVEEETGEIIEVPNFVQVTDHRGSNAGWTLTVRQNGAFKNGTHELNGTELTFKNPVLSSISGNSKIAPAANATMTLTAEGQAVLAMVAKEDQGMGTWLERFGENNEAAKASITLSVPGESQKKAGFYRTSLTWTLSDVPANE